MTTTDIENIEIPLLLEAILNRYGYDFREYAFSSLRRRIWKRILAEKLDTVSGLQERVLHDPECMARLFYDFSINVTDFFRDPDFYIAFRTKVVPLLRTYPFVRIWHAGCSTGEEVYSMAILLSEEGLYERCRIYATDINDTVLEKAKSGIFALKSMQEFTKNYIRAGGEKEFSEYYTAKADDAIFKQSLKKNLVFSKHNLASDGSFNEFNVILCRNVLIYFNKQLQDRVHNLFFDSLGQLGFLCLGKSENINFSAHCSDYSVFDNGQKIYRKE